MLPERSEDREVMAPGQPRLDRPVGARAEAVQVGVNGFVAEVRHALRIRASSSASVRWSSAGGVSFARQSSHTGYDSGQVDHAAVDARDAANRFGASPRRFQHHRAAPGLAGEDRPLEPERADQRAKVGGRRVEVVAPLRSVGPAVAPLIDRATTVWPSACRCAATPSQSRTFDASPCTRTNGAAARSTRSLLDVEEDAGRDLDASLDRSRHGDARMFCHGRNRSTVRIGQGRVQPEEACMAHATIEGLAGVLVWTEAGRFPAMARFYRDTLGLDSALRQAGLHQLRLERRAPERGRSRRRPRREPRARCASCSI